jgi:hypothetical protein
MYRPFRGGPPAGQRFDRFGLEQRRVPGRPNSPGGDPRR